MAAHEKAAGDGGGDREEKKQSQAASDASLPYRSPPGRGPGGAGHPGLETLEAESVVENYLDAAQRAKLAQ